jgi:predicted NBD/HSP70 family sugar kinase
MNDRAADGPPAHRAPPSAAVRWRTASAALTELRRGPGITRAELARRLGLSSGSATELAARLRELRLLDEVPAAPRGRGRPSSALRPHPAGPMVLVVELRHAEWRAELVTLDGTPEPLEHAPHGGGVPPLAPLTAMIARASARYGRRLRAVSFSAAATVGRGRLLDVSSLGWPPVDLTTLTELPVLVGNDATLAGVAEARSGAAADSRTALHLLVEAGIGGCLTVDGRPVTGATGAAGEYGHLPFADRALRCPCGASGCWQLEVCGTALARRLGDPPPDRPRDYTAALLHRATRDPATRAALADSARALGAGVAGLVNLHDPGVVTLGGLAGPLRASAAEEFRAAYREGLMAFRRPAPPPVLDAAHSEDGARRGAAAVALDHITSEAALAGWAADAHPADATRASGPRS